MNHSISEMLTSSLGKIQDMVDVNTIIGNPITTPDGLTIIPVCKVKIGMGGGGSDFASKNVAANKDNPFGGGLGCGIDVTPVAFLVVNGTQVRMMPVAQPASSTVDRVIESAPDLIDKFADFLDGRKEAKQPEEEKAD